MGHFISAEYVLIITVAVFYTVIVRADTKVRSLNRALFKADTTQCFIEVLDMVGSHIHCLIVILMLGFQSHGKHHIIGLCGCFSNALYRNRSCHLSLPPFSGDFYDLPYEHFTGLRVPKNGLNPEWALLYAQQYLYKNCYAFNR